MFALKRNGKFVEHVVFEAANSNYRRSNVCVLVCTSLKSANELLNVWSDAEVVGVTNNLPTPPTFAIME